MYAPDINHDKKRQTTPFLMVEGTKNYKPRLAQTRMQTNIPKTSMERRKIHKRAVSVLENY